MSDSIQLLHGDCLELMKGVPDGSVDMICADLPYGTTNCHWDVRLPMEPLWEQFWRVAKHNAAICLFAQQPFATDLINAARERFRYEWVWVKTHVAGILNAHKMPLRVHEFVLVFYRALPKYNPQKWVPDFQKSSWSSRKPHCKGSVYGARKAANYKGWEETGSRWPIDVVRIPLPNRPAMLCPTEKPVALLEMLVKTYTDAGELVLDPTMGSGSCGVACANAGRRFTGMEKDAHFFEVAGERIAAAETRAGRPRPQGEDGETTKGTDE